MSRCFRSDTGWNVAFEKNKQKPTASVNPDSRSWLVGWFGADSESCTVGPASTKLTYRSGAVGSTGYVVRVWSEVKWRSERCEEYVLKATDLSLPLQAIKMSFMRRFQIYLNMKREFLWFGGWGGDFIFMGRVVWRKSFRSVIVRNIYIGGLQYLCTIRVVNLFSFFLQLHWLPSFFDFVNYVLVPVCVQDKPETVCTFGQTPFAEDQRVCCLLISTFYRRFAPDVWNSCKEQVYMTYASFAIKFMYNNAVRRGKMCRFLLFVYRMHTPFVAHMRKHKIKFRHCKRPMKFVVWCWQHVCEPLWRWQPCKFLCECLLVLTRRRVQGFQFRGVTSSDGSPLLCNVITVHYLPQLLCALFPGSYFGPETVNHDWGFRVFSTSFQAL